jgi:hypothetical protein
MSQFECKLSDLEEPKKEVNQEQVSQEKKVQFDERVNVNANETIKELQKDNEKASYFDIISDNKNTIFVIVIIYLLLNTTAVKDIVFKILPQLMNSSTEYNLIGTLISALLLGIVTTFFISYF